MHSFDSNSNIPTFILKLWKLVEDEESNDLICWNRDGRSFIIYDQARFAKELLPMYFKHSNMASFIRQLNMYGFRKISNIENGLKSDGDEVEFFHQCFSLGQEEQLQYIKRKLSNNNKSLTSIVKVDEVQDILSDVESMKGRQDSVDTSLNTMKRENEALWREVAILRQKHLKQQQIVEKLLNFLVSIVRNRVVSGIKRKAPLMIDSNSVANRKVMKTNKESVCLASPSPGISGPIIHDITDLDDNCDLSPLMNDSSNQLINALPLNLDNPDLTFQLVEESPKDNSSIEQNISKISLPETMLDFNLTDDSDNVNLNEISFEDKMNSVLSTPKIVYDETPTTSSKKPMILGKTENETDNSPSVNTDLILSKQNSSIAPSINRLTADTFTDHLDGIDEELNWLQDQLYDGSLYFDPSQLLEIFSDEQFPVQLEPNTSASKAIMDGSNDSNLRLIKVEDNSNDGLFEDLDLNNITHDTKDILSEVDFTSDMDPSHFN